MIKKIFLTLLFFSFIFSEVFRVETIYGFGIMVLDTLVIGGGTIWYLSLLYQRKLRQDTVSRFFFAFILIGAIGLLLNPLHVSLIQLEVAGLYLVRYMSYGLLFLSLREEEGLKPCIFKGLLISGASIVLLGFTQFFFYNSLRNLFYLGWDEHLHRLFTTFLDPNFAGIFFTLFLLYLFYSLFHKRLPQRLLYGLILLTTLGLFLTYSRSSYVCAAIGILLLFFLERKKKELFVFLGGALILFLLLLPTFFTHNTDLFRIASSLSRLHSYEQGFTIAKDNVVFGIGFNTYRYAVQKYGYHIPTDVIYNHSEAGNDNSFLFVFVTTGIIGLITYLSFLYLFIKQAAVEREKGIVWASIIVLIVGSFFNNVLFYTPLLFWFYLLCGMITKNTSRV